MKKIVVLSLIGALNATGFSYATPIEQFASNQVVINPIQPRGTIYRCQSCFPHVEDTWVQFAYNDDVSKIIGMWSWDSLDKNPATVKILKQTVFSDDETGANGTAVMPFDGATYSFSAFGSNLTLTDSDGNEYTFAAEGFVDEEGNYHFIDLDLDFDFDLDD